MADMQKNTSFIRIFGLLLILAFVAGAILLLFEHNRTQAQVLEGFIHIRAHAAEGFSKARQDAQADFPYLFIDCESRASYDNYIGADTRTLSATELKEALVLHGECGKLFLNKNRFVLAEFRKTVDMIHEHATLFGSGAKAKNAKVDAGYWEEIYELEREAISIHSRLVDIQEAYWKHDLNKALGLISSEEREANVGALNLEANQTLARSQEVATKIKERREVEGLFWNEAFPLKETNEKE